MFVVSKDTHKHDITCTKFDCESKVLKANAIDVAEKTINASIAKRDLLLGKYALPNVSEIRKKTTERDALGRILLAPRGRPRSKRSDSQRKDGKKVVFVHGVLGVGGVNNKNIGFVKVLTKDYYGY